MKDEDLEKFLSQSLQKIEALMEHCESIGESGPGDMQSLQQEMKSLKEWLEKYRQVDSAINQAYLKLASVRWNSNPMRSQWHHHLYDAQIDISYRLADFK